MVDLNSDEKENLSHKLAHSNDVHTQLGLTYQARIIFLTALGSPTFKFLNSAYPPIVLSLTSALAPENYARTLVLRCFRKRGFARPNIGCEKSLYATGVS